MKAKLFLVCSLAANVGLAAMWLSSRPVPATVEASPKEETAAEAKTKVLRAIKTKNASTVREKQLDWSTVESADYRAYIENLRSISCPEETIRDIIIADINKLYAPKFAALYPSPADFKFWQTTGRSDRKGDREREEKRHVLEKEKRDLIKELLGVDYETEMAGWSGKPDEDAWRYGFLSPEKQVMVRALMDKYRDMERAIFNEGGGWSPENRAKFSALRAQREAEMAAILGPSEFQEYQLRSSWTARNMRESLGPFQPTEEEFRKIFDQRKSYDDQFAFTRDSSDEAAREQRRTAQQEMEDKLRTVLGEERFHEYQLAQDDHYREVYDFGQQYNWTPTLTEVVYNVRTEVDKRRHEIERDPNLTNQQRAQALATLFNETKQSLEPSVGSDVWNDIQGNQRWLARLIQPDFGRDPHYGRNRDGFRGSH